MLPNLTTLQSNVDLTNKLRFVKSSLNVKAHSDPSLVEKAAAQLKRMQVRSSFASQQNETAEGDIRITRDVSHSFLDGASASNNVSESDAVKRR